MLLLIDADTIVYSSCFASRGACLLLAIDYAENSLYAILNKWSSADFEVYLTGRGNYRNKVADYYKANRVQQKPPFFNEVRQYLIEYWDAIVTEGNEADDAIGIRHREDTIVCSIDKDMLTLPGANYNYRKDEIVVVTESAARFNFWVQMLTGDTADNIPGIKNPAKAHHKNPPNFSEASAKELLLESDNWRETVERMYELQYGEEWEKEFDIHATLLFIQRKDAKTYKECNLLYPDDV